MAIRLDVFEAGKAYGGVYEADLRALQQRLERIQIAHIIHRRPAIIVFEGWDGSGKAASIGALTAGWDARWFKVWSMKPPCSSLRRQHFLRPFWEHLPDGGEISIFDGSWYRRVLGERVSGVCDNASWRRSFDEINEFEAQQRDHGVTLVKIFLHITQAEQDRRLRERLQDPWTRWKTDADRLQNHVRREDYLDVYHTMLDRTDTAWAPWTVVDANNERSARIWTLSAIADALESKVSMTPADADPDVMRLAEEILGGSITLQDS